MAGAMRKMAVYLGLVEDDGYDGPLVLTIHANGGWDPTLFCDPKAPNVNIQQNLYSQQLTCSQMHFQHARL